MEAVLTHIGDYLRTQSWQIALLAMAVALASWVLRNRSAHVRYLLWLLVLAKCLIPPIVQVPLALLPDQTPPILAPIIPIAPRPEAIAKAPVEETPLPTGSSVAPASPPLDTQRGLAFVWLVGVTVFVSAALTKATRTLLWLRRRRRMLSRDSEGFIADTLQSLRVKHTPRVWLIEGVGQPFVWGILRGDIYLPDCFARITDEDHRKDILAHEISHVLRFDAAVNLLQTIAQAVFWFHPFVWWANRKIRQEREKCCDEMAIAELGSQPADYSAAIVKTLIQAQESTRPVPSLAVAGPARNIEERIRTMLRPGKRFQTRPSLAVATLVALTALVAVPTTLVLTSKAAAQPTTPSADKPVAASERPQQPGFAARTFNSKVAFRVYVQENSEQERRFIGRTPSATPVEIPACWLWYVQISTPVEDWESLAREITQNKVPGLILWSAAANPDPAAADSDVSHLADLTGLRALGLAGNQITDAGLEHLRGLMAGLRLLDLSYTQVTDTGLAHLKGLTGLEWLDLSGEDSRSSSLRVMRITDAGLAHLKGLTGLRVLRLEGTQITDAGLEHLKGLTALQWLDLYNTRITGAGLEYLSGLAGLHVLWLMETEITDAGLEHLKGMTGLQELALSDTLITDAGLAHLKGLTGLQDLTLSGRKITYAGLEHLKSLTGLRDLGLGDTQITNAGLARLKGLAGLEILKLSGTGITDAGLEHLKGLTGLDALDLPAQITDAGLEHLKGLTKMRYLNLSGTQTTNAGLEHLKGLTGLEILDLSGTGITDAGLEHLKGLTKLRDLLLNNTQITDAGLEHLKGLTGLQRLDLMNTKISDAGLEHLRGLTKMRDLCLSRTQTTDAGVQQLKQSLPYVGRVK